ncbi:hypothetical protein [Paraburkholderia sp. J67]|uniref:hypothetical protein n=1 Tax=Paraburkholderia sp. J67 TaxID=2805435 RepID=UPI002ABDF24E|nr:hypothetical protein [Paraburkholderia sp. J67]
MSAAAPIRPTPSTLLSWAQGACEWASRLGIYLLPVFYLAFFVVLFLLWCAPLATFWLVAAGGALGWAMAVWALVFCLASLRRAAAIGLEPADPGHLPRRSVH